MRHGSGFITLLSLACSILILGPAGCGLLPTTNQYFDNVVATGSYASPEPARPSALPAAGFQPVSFASAPSSSAAPPAGPTLARRSQTALVIGINQYQKWPQLRNAVNDARAFAQILKTQYGFHDVIELYDAQGSRENIMNAMRDLVGRLQPGEDVLVFFSGHGFFDDALNCGYWVPVDAQSVNDFLPNSQIYDIVKAMDAKKAGHVLVIADSCFSGSFLSESKAIVARPPGGDNGAASPYLQRLYASPSRQAFSSGAKNEQVPDAGKDGHSNFAYYLIQSLTRPEYPAFTATEMAVYVQRNLVNNTQQSPRYGMIPGTGHETGEFIFVKSN